MCLGSPELFQVSNLLTCKAYYGYRVCWHLSLALAAGHTAHFVLGLGNHENNEDNEDADTDDSGVWRYVLSFHFAALISNTKRALCYGKAHHLD